MTADEILDRRRQAAESVAGLLSAAAIFIGLIGLAYRPVKLIPFAIVMSLVAAAIGGRHSRLHLAAVLVSSACIVLGITFAVITSNPLW